ncbi:MAG: hypothetical protein IIW98_04105, partial [Bacteroidaceae bacterium]|nr:hypothetical protein [Bacteroidaceae bacterium]
SLYASLLCFLGRDRVWGVEDPGHRLISRLYATHGAEVRHLPLELYSGTVLPLDATGIDAVADLPSKTRETFDLQGRRIGKAQEGINIIRNTDGTTKKVLTKH